MSSEKPSNPCKSHNMWHSKNCTLFLCTVLPVRLIGEIIIGRNLEFETFCWRESLTSMMYKYRSRLSRCDMTMFQESAWIQMNISVCVEILNESCISWCRSFASERHWLDMGRKPVNWWVLKSIWLSDLKKFTRSTFQQIDEWQLFSDEIRLIEDIWKRITLFATSLHWLCFPNF
jgi:hypothetical protein